MAKFYFIEKNGVSQSDRYVSDQLAHMASGVATGFYQLLPREDRCGLVVAAGTAASIARYRTEEVKEMLEERFDPQFHPTNPVVAIIRYDLGKRTELSEMESTILEQLMKGIGMIPC